MSKLKKILEAQNVASLLDAEELATISKNAVDGYEGDEDSRSEWKERNKKGMELAMQISETKSFPFENAANVKYPLLSVACIQFASRAYPNLITGWDIVKGKAIGDDPTGEKAGKATRIGTHMNYQLNQEMEEWEEETDKLFTLIPLLGCCFKETYFSKVLGRNVSVFCSPEDIVMHYKAKSMQTVPRITKKYELYPNEIIERMRQGTFIDFDMGQPVTLKDDKASYYSGDDYQPHLFLQQHTWLDLDDDGYKEPYILNIHYDTKKVVRIVPRFNASSLEFNDDGKIRRIEAKQYYTKFTFMPSPDGSIYDWGFGSLLTPIGHSVNTAVNQLLDSGTISNSQGGFLGKGINLGRGRGGGPIRLAINEWMPVAHSGDDLRKSIVPLPKSEPSAVLFNLLGFMVQAGEKLSSVSELLLGDQSVQNEPATTSLARIEQGLKVFSAIHKRIHRSFKKEFKLLFDLNAEYLNPEHYYTILDSANVNEKIMRSDYDKDSCDIIPTSSPEDISNTQKIFKAQALMALQGQGFNDTEIKKRYIEALQVPDPESILKPMPERPDPKIEIEKEKVALERTKFEFEMMKFKFDIAKIRSEIIKNLAEAEAKEEGQQLEQYKAEADKLLKMTEAKTKQKEVANAKNKQ